MEAFTNYYKHHLGDYADATTHLTWDEDMAYTRLLRVYYRIEGPIPKGEQYRLCRARSSKQKKAVDCILFEFFVEIDNFYRNSRCDVEIASYKEKVAFNQRVGKLGGRPRGNPERTRTLTETVSGNNPSHTPIANSQEPEVNLKTKATRANGALPDWIPEEPWKSWLEVRSKIRAPNTPRALRLAINQLEKLRRSGYEPGMILENATLRGWRGLFPVKTQENTLPAALIQVCAKCAKPANSLIQTSDGRLCPACRGM